MIRLYSCGQLVIPNSNPNHNHKPNWVFAYCLSVTLYLVCGLLAAAHISSEIEV